jgi:glycosyltransferase involved in cell wall biosynthesis
MTTLSSPLPLTEAPPRSRPLRIMRIITRLNIGGPSYQAIYLSQRLEDSEFTTRLMVGEVGPREGSLEELAEERGVTFTRVPGLGREISLRADGTTVRRLYREMAQFRPDIVHTHLAKAGAVGRTAARLAGVPLVVHTYHGHVFHSYFSPAKTKLFLRIERKLASWTHRLIVLSESQRREILGYGVGDASRMACIPLGLELESFLHAEKCRGQLRSELGVGDAPLVGIVARLVPVKAHDLFLDAACRVAAARPDARFVIVGDGELRDVLEQRAASLGFAVSSGDGRRESDLPATGYRLPPTNCHFLGNRTDLPAIYADLDAVVLCSRNEGLPVTIIEALAAARPVVATDVGAVRDLVTPGETGWLVPSGDATALADGILGALSDREAADAVGRRGRGHVYPRLSLERLERDIRSLYLQLAEVNCGRISS